MTNEIDALEFLDELISEEITPGKVIQVQSNDKNKPFMSVLETLFF